MTPFDQLVAHLKNLQSKKTQQVTLDVNWLLNVLDVVNVKQPVMHKSHVMDGGAFVDDDN